MTTEELVDELIQLHNGWNRDGEHGVLRYLAQAHDILMSVESQQTMIFDETNGKLPALNTTAGVYQYVMPSNVRRVTAILVQIDTEAIVYDYGLLYDYGMQKRLPIGTSDQNSILIGGTRYAKIPYMRSWDRVNDTALARLMFTKDPGTKTDYYFRQSYKRPTQITSETIQPDIASPYDVKHLLPAASKLIEGAQKFNLFEAMEYVDSVIKPKLWKELDAGDQGDMDMEPVGRGF